MSRNPEERFGLHCRVRTVRKGLIFGLQARPRPRNTSGERSNYGKLVLKEEIPQYLEEYFECWNFGVARRASLRQVFSIAACLFQARNPSKGKSK